MGHSLECGGGTGIFLSVNSSTIIVVRGKRACVWGSVFLDFFGEEDKELKRGKPLYLNEKRYQLLEHQWVSHKLIIPINAGCPTETPYNEQGIVSYLFLFFFVEER